MFERNRYNTEQILTAFESTNIFKDEVIQLEVMTSSEFDDGNIEIYLPNIQTNCLQLNRYLIKDVLSNIVIFDNMVQDFVKIVCVMG